MEEKVKVLEMAKPLQAPSHGKETHYPGEPWSMEELENIPHLRPVSKSIRDVLHITNKYLRDIDLQNKQDYENFVERLNSDLVFRLKVTHQYHLLLNLFKDPHEKSRWIKFLNEIRAEEQASHQKQQQNASPITRVQTPSRPIDSASNQPVFHWTHPDPNLSNMQKWQHYELELQRMTLDYQVQRIRIHKNALETDIQSNSGYIDRMIRALRRDVPEEHRAIEELNKIKEDVSTKVQEIMSIPTYREDGTRDHHAVAEQEKQMDLLRQELDSRIKGVIENLTTENAELNALCAERSERQLMFSKEINELDSQYIQQKNELMVHLSTAREASKQEVVDNLDKLIDKLKGCEVNEQQGEHLDNSIRRLEAHQKTLRDTDDFEVVQNIVQQCQEELVRVKDYVSPESYHQIKPEVEAFGKMLIQANPEPQKNSIEPSDTQSKQEPEKIEAPSPAEHPVLDEKVVSEQRIIVEPSRLDGSLMQDKQEQETVPNNQELDAVVENLDERREQYSRLRLMARSMSQEPTLSVSPQNSDEIDSSLEEMDAELEEILNNDDFSDFKDIAQKTKEQLIVIRESSSYQDVSEDIKNSFYENLKNLGDLDSKFSKFSDTYAPLFKPEESPQIRV